MRTYAPMPARECRVRARSRRRLRSDGVAGALHVRVERLRSGNPTGIRSARGRSRRGVPAARPRLRRLADRARAVRAAARPVGRGAARRLPAGRRAGPARRGLARRVADGADAHGGRPDVRACGHRADRRRQPAHAKRAGIRAFGGSARRMPVRRRRALLPGSRKARARGAGGCAAGAGDRQQGVGAAGSRAGRARARRRPRRRPAPARGHAQRRGRRRAPARAAAARVLGTFRGRRTCDRAVSGSVVQAVAGVLVLRLARQAGTGGGNARRVPRRSGVGQHDQPSPDHPRRTASGGWRMASLQTQRAALRRARRPAAAGARAAASLHARHVGPRLLHAALPAGPRRLGGDGRSGAPAVAGARARRAAVVCPATAHCARRQRRRTVRGPPGMDRAAGGVARLASVLRARRGTGVANPSARPSARIVQACSGEDRQRARQARERLAAAVAHQHELLDTHAQHARAGRRRARP